MGLLENKDQVKEKAKEKNLNPGWALETLEKLKVNCEAALGSGGALVTLFE
jgi:hypothetical protein